MKILCLLQNGWGFRGKHIAFAPNPLNKSAKTMRKVCGLHVMHFANTTAKFGITPDVRLPIDPVHMEHLASKVMPRYDLVIVCGKQAYAAVCNVQTPMAVPMLAMPHPASRTLRNTTLDQVRIKVYRLLSSPNVNDTYRIHLIKN